MTSPETDYGRVGVGGAFGDVGKAVPTENTLLCGARLEEFTS